MIETLRKQTKKSLITRVIVCAVIAAALLFATKFAVFDVITGPAEMDIAAAPESYEGKYVTVEAHAVLMDYVEHTTTTTNTRSGSKSTRVDGNSYLVFSSVPDYESGTDTWYYYSIYLDEASQPRLYGKMDATWEYLLDETGTAAPPESEKVTGTWTKMEGELKQYFEESLSELGLVETDYDKFYGYMLDTEHLGGQTTILFWALNAAALVLVLYALYCLISIFTNRYMADIHKYLLKHSDVSIAAIEADFAPAHVIGKCVWIGKKWTVFVSGPKAFLLENKDMVWGYYYQRTGKHSVSEIRLYFTDKSMRSISMPETMAQEALKLYTDEQPQMVIGYDKELEKKFRKDFEGFLNLKYNPAKQAAQTAELFGDRAW